MYAARCLVTGYEAQADVYGSQAYASPICFIGHGQNLHIHKLPLKRQALPHERQAYINLPVKAGAGGDCMDL